MLIVLFCFYILDQEPVSETFVFVSCAGFSSTGAATGSTSSGRRRTSQYRGVQLQELLQEEGSIGENYNCFDRALILVTRMNPI